jgi:hypothetical protein
MEGDAIIQKRAEQGSPTNKTVLAGRVAIGIGAIAVIVGLLVTFNILPTLFAFIAVIFSIFAITAFTNNDEVILASISSVGFVVFGIALATIIFVGIANAVTGLAAIVAGVAVISSQHKKRFAVKTLEQANQPE